MVELEKMDVIGPPGGGNRLALTPLRLVFSLLPPEFDSTVFFFLLGNSFHLGFWFRIWIPIWDLIRILIWTSLLLLALLVEADHPVF